MVKLAKLGLPTKKALISKRFSRFHVGHHVGHHVDHLADMMADMKSD